MQEKLGVVVITHNLSAQTSREVNAEVLHCRSSWFLTSLTQVLPFSLVSLSTSTLVPL